jgi:hypothetical protein
MLYLFVPARLYFFPLLNTVTPVVVLGCAFLLQRWLLTRQIVHAILLGAAVYLLVLFDPLPLVMGLLFAVLIVRAWTTKSIDLRTLLRHGGAGLLAFAVTYLFFLAMFRFDLFTTLRHTQAEAAAFNATLHRPYGIWAAADILEFAFATGICQMVIFCGILAYAVWHAMTASDRLAMPIVALSIGLAAVLLSVDLLGVNRGEVTRLWIFLACFFQIPVAYACARLRSRPSLILILGTTLLQIVLGTSMIAFVLP